MIAPENWVPAAGLTLEPGAWAAATERVNSLALTAGPGAGKTEMLAQRADFLFRTGACRYPQRILAIAFKVDASQNLKRRVRQRCGASFAVRLDSYTFHAFAKRIIDRFRLVLTGRDALDADYTIGSNRVHRRQISFMDMVPLAIQILRTSPVALNAIRSTYSDVFLDEFQDCTNAQYELVQLAFRGTSVRLTAVGDTKQRIMGWAGALEGIFETYHADFAATSLNLYRNFRSLPVLLRMQNRIILRLDPTSVMPPESIVGEGGEISTLAFDTAEDEAGVIADLVQASIAEGLPLSEIAILISKQPDLYAEHLFATLADRGVPFRNEHDVQDLIAEPIAQLILAYLRVLYGARQPTAWATLMRLLLPFVDDDEAESTRRDWGRFLRTERENALLQELIDGSFESRWQFVTRMLERLGTTGIAALSQDYQSDIRVRELLDQIRERIAVALADRPDVVIALDGLSEVDAVRVLTIHKSKGLEFDTVILIGVEEETFWSDADAERCAYFVAISRAKRRLILTHCQQRSRPTRPAQRWSTNRTAHQEFLAYAEADLRKAAVVLEM